MNFRNWFRANNNANRSRRDASKRTRRSRLCVERLEDRLVPSTFSVFNTGDNGGVNPAPFAGTGTLRQAIVDANASANVGGPDVIRFDILGAGVHTISPMSQLPDFTDPAIIDGYTQAGAKENTLGIGPGSLGHDLGDGDNAVLQIELDGSLAGSSAGGLHIATGGSTIRGLAINRFATYGIFLSTGDGNTVAGNFVGTDPTGTIAEGNIQDGVLIGYYSPQYIPSNGNTVGGLTPAARNVISGNGGVNLHLEPSAGNLIESNFIGTDATGKVALSTAAGFRSGVFIFRCDNNTIGGITANARNIISGNSGGSGNGVEIYTDSSAGGNQVLGNYIGTDVTGMHAVPNVQGVLSWYANTIGGTAPGSGNLISGNTGVGAYVLVGGVVQGNLIGTKANGTEALGNGRGLSTYQSIVGGTTAAARNVISGNTGDGIFAVNGGNVIQGNYIGTDITGTVPLGNSTSGGGIYVASGNNDLIGGAVPGARNVIADNGYREVLVSNSSSHVVIQGNYIGTDMTGNVPMGNLSWGFGVHIWHADHVQVIGNVIGDRQVGVMIEGTDSFDNVVQGNSIGLGADGLNSLPNGTGVGLNGGTTNNTIGGTTPAAANIIANNGNGVGMAHYANAPYTTGNAVLGNRIFNSTGLGIDISMDSVNGYLDGPNPNDPGDADVGDNNLQNYPVLTNVVNGASSTTIQGTLNSTPNSTFRVEFFSNSTVKSNGYSEGEHYHGYTDVTTDANGDVRDAHGNLGFTVTLSTPSIASQYVTATATDSAGNTSEFSLAYQAPAKTISVTTATGGTFIYDGTPHAGSGSVDVIGGSVSIRYEGVGTTTYSSTAAPTNAGSYEVIATYAGDANHYGSTASAALTIRAKLLEASAWSQGTINIGSNGSIVLHLAVDRGQLYGSDTVASLFNGATFTIRIEKADGTTTYGTLTSIAKVEADGGITVSMQMNDSLRAELYDAYVSGRAVNFEVTALANGGNYWLDEDTMSKLLNNGALKYVA